MKKSTTPVAITTIEKSSVSSFVNGNRSPNPVVLRVSTTKKRAPVQEIGFPSRTG